LSRSRHKKDGLKSKVQKFWFPKDDEGLFVPICDMQYHRGIIKKHHICERRKCEHYRKAYIGEKEYEQNTRKT